MLDLLDARAVDRVRRQERLRRLGEFALARCAAAAHALPERDGLRRVEARLGHDLEADVVRLALHRARVRQRHEQVERHAAQPDVEAEHVHEQPEHIHHREPRHFFRRVPREDVRNLVREHGREPVVVLAHGQNAGEHKDGAARERKRVLLRARDDVHVPLCRRRAGRTLAVQVAAHVDDALRDAAHTHRVRRPRRQDAVAVRLHGLLVRLAPELVLVGDAHVEEAPAPRLGYLLQVADVVDAAGAREHEDDGELALALRELRRCARALCGCLVRIQGCAAAVRVVRRRRRCARGACALLVACAVRSADGFLDQLAAHLRGYDLDDQRVRTAILATLMGQREVDSLIHEEKLPTTPMGIATAPVGDADLEKVVARNLVNVLMGQVAGKKLPVFVSKRVPVLGGGVGATTDGFTTWSVARYARKQFPTRRPRG